MAARRLMCRSGSVDSLNGRRGWARKDKRKEAIRWQVKRWRSNGGGEREVPK